MADKPTLNDLTSGAINVTTLNENFSDIEEAIEGCLGRGGTGESPNSMTEDLDMDLNRIINLGPPTASGDAARLQDIEDAADIDSGLVSFRAELASTALGYGASLIGIHDTDSNFTATTLEGVLVEIAESYYTETESDVLLTEASPPGAITAFARNTTPPGWLKANGATISRTTYADLFTAIGTTFGVGDGSTTFALPDLRGEFIRGWDNSRGVDTGRVFGSSQADGIKSHSHPTYGDESGYRHPVRAGADAPIDATSGATSVEDAHYSSSSRTDATGGTETRPRNVALLYCIKY